MKKREQIQQAPETPLFFNEHGFIASLDHPEYDHDTRTTCVVAVRNSNGDLYFKWNRGKQQFVKVANWSEFKKIQLFTIENAKIIVDELFSRGVVNLIIYDVANPKIIHKF